MEAIVRTGDARKVGIAIKTATYILAGPVQVRGPVIARIPGAPGTLIARAPERRGVPTAVAPQAETDPGHRCRQDLEVASRAMSQLRAGGKSLGDRRLARLAAVAVSRTYRDPGADTAVSGAIDRSRRS